nr:aminoglycoside phosphotransferase family protein [Kitasatospora purpeofusca]
MLTLTEKSSRAAVFSGAWSQGLDPSGAVLIKEGANHVYRLPAAGAIAKVHQPGTTVGAARRQNRAALWLLRNDIAAARPTGRYTDPEQIGPLVITFADDLGTGPAATSAELGGLLRALHDLDVPNELDLPVFEPFTALARRIAALPPTALTRQQRLRLRLFLDATRDRWNTVSWPVRPCVIHGDVGPSNTILTALGQPALIDLENIAIGPALWDLAAPALRRDLYGDPPAQYEEFSAAYGADVTRHDNGRTYRTLTALYALTSCLTAVEAAQVHGGHWPAEAERRLSTVLTDPLPAPPWAWTLPSVDPEHAR